MRSRSRRPSALPCMSWFSRKTGSPHFWIRREVTFCVVKCRWREVKRRTLRNHTAAQSKRQDPQTLSGRGPRRGSSMAMTQGNGGRVSTRPCRKRNPMREPIVHRVGGFILQEFCKSRSEKRRKETRRCGKHCSPRKLECPITSAGWHSRELHLKLNLNDLDAPLTKSLREFLRSAAVCNQTPDSVVRPDSRNAAAAQFTEVRNDIHFARGTDHHVIELSLQHIRR